MAFRLLGACSELGAMGWKWRHGAALACDGLGETWESGCEWRAGRFQDATCRVRVRQGRPLGALGSIMTQGRNGLPDRPQRLNVSAATESAVALG